MEVLIFIGGILGGFSMSILMATHSYHKGKADGYKEAQSDLRRLQDINNYLNDQI
jgi:hypothetical protein